LREESGSIEPVLVVETADVRSVLKFGTFSGCSSNIRRVKLFHTVVGEVVTSGDSSRSSTPETSLNSSPEENLAVLLRTDGIGQQERIGFIPAPSGAKRAPEGFVLNAAKLLTRFRLQHSGTSVGVCGK